MILNVCAVRNAFSEALFSLLKISLIRVSSPMQTNAIEKNIPWKFFARDLYFTIFPSISTPPLNQTLNTAEATIIPRTNFGKRCHIIVPLVSMTPLVSRSDQNKEIPNAASPSNTFCDALTMTAVSPAISPRISPEAATAAVVSIVPPIHAPATCCAATLSCGKIIGSSQLQSIGMIYNIGMATTITKEMT